MFKHPGFFNLVESCRKVEVAYDVLSIPHSTEQRGNPTKASGTLNYHISRSISKSLHQLFPRQQRQKYLLVFLMHN